VSLVDFAAIAATLPDHDLAPVDTDLHRLPEQWQPIAAEADPATRLTLASALWNAPLLEVLPQFAAALQTRFTDVKPCIADGEFALLYVATGPDDRVRAWVGYDPAGFVEPQFWGHFAEPLQTFLSHVHAGFTSGGPGAFGPMRPVHMETLAELAGEPDGVADWDEEQEIASTRLLLVASNGGMLRHCVSPDLPAGEVAIVYEGDIDPTAYGEALDELLMLRFDF
jgi:hypothetical protein